MKVKVEVYESKIAYEAASPLREYVMDHDDQSQRRVLGEQCRNAFEGGQIIVTMPA